MIFSIAPHFNHFVKQMAQNVLDDFPGDPTDELRVAMYKEYGVAFKQCTGYDMWDVIHIVHGI